MAHIGLFSGHMFLRTAAAVLKQCQCAAGSKVSEVQGMNAVIEESTLKRQKSSNPRIINAP
jgi:hypothetical protein